MSFGGLVDFLQPMGIPSSQSSASGGAALVGQPIVFRVGQFAGQTIRAELHELQKAEHGRKCAVKDRRPVDPPPVAELLLYQVFNVGTPGQWESEIEDYDGVHCSGILCHIDLFIAPDTTAPPSAPVVGAEQVDGWEEQSHVTQQQLSPLVMYRWAMDTDRRYVSPAGSSSAAQMRIPDLADYHSPWYPHPEERRLDQDQSFRLPHFDSAAFFPEAMESGLAQDQYDEALDPKRTADLAGTTFVQAAKVQYEGRTRLLFVFSDISVKIEGTFLLRYRCFDVLSVAMGQAERPVWAECYGGSFRIWPSKNVPGLLPSTPLTKCIADAGISVNNRRQAGQGGPEDVRRLSHGHREMVGLSTVYSKPK